MLQWVNLACAACVVGTRGASDYITLALNIVRLVTFHTKLKIIEQSGSREHATSTAPGAARDALQKCH